VPCEIGGRGSRGRLFRPRKVKIYPLVLGISLEAPSGLGARRGSGPGRAPRPSHARHTRAISTSSWLVFRKMLLSRRMRANQRSSGSLATICTGLSRSSRARHSGYSHASPRPPLIVVGRRKSARGGENGSEELWRRRRFDRYVVNGTLLSHHLLLLRHPPQPPSPLPRSSSSSFLLSSSSTVVAAPFPRKPSLGRRRRPEERSESSSCLKTSIPFTPREGERDARARLLTG